MSSHDSLNIVFAGTPVFAAIHLQALLSSHHNIVAVYSQPDKPAGRGKKLTASPVKLLALEHNIPVFQPASLKNEQAQQELAALNADIMVVVAYGLLLPKTVLDTPRLGCINVHGSILPQWRGAAPIQRAIEAGDALSGITIMQMDVGLDTGDMLLKAECPILETDSTIDLHDRLCDIGPPALLQTLDLISSGTTTPESQQDQDSTYARKIEKHEAIINWQESNQCICRKIRAFNPFPICYAQLKGERVRIQQAHCISAQTTTLAPGEIAIKGNEIWVGCGEGIVAIDYLQLAGKKATHASEFLNGFKHLLSNQSFDLVNEVTS